MTQINKDIKITIKDLQVSTIIGVLKEERESPQELLIDAKIKFDASGAMKSDDLNDAIDYFKMAKLIQEKVQGSHFQLLEKLLDFLLRVIMKVNLVEEVKLTIYKPQALKKFGALVSVTGSAHK
jgi:FolB domain-containing protein